MICPVCHGSGKLRLPPIPTYAGQSDDGYHNIIAGCGWWPCPACHGGHQHCCEGERSQPEPQEKGE